MAATNCIDLYMDLYELSKLLKEFLGVSIKTDAHCTDAEYIADRRLHRVRLHPLLLLKISCCCCRLLRMGCCRSK